MYEFEKHPKLTEFIQEMANTGRAPREWTSFIETLNQALRIHDVVGQSEQLKAFLLFIQENAPNYRTKQLKPDQVLKAYIESL